MTLERVGALLIEYLGSEEWRVTVDNRIEFVQARSRAEVLAMFDGTVHELQR